MHWRRFAAFEFPGLPGGRALRRACLALGLLLSAVSQPRAAVLWSDLGATQVHETGPGMDILGGVLKRDDTSSDVLYFKFHVEPLSDVLTEEYFACFALYETNVERLAVGNSLKAWAYSAYNTEAIGEFNKIQGDIDLHSGRPESSAPGQFLPYELPRRGTERTIVFKVHYIPGAPDEITAWLDPDLSLGATEDSQAEGTVTHFAANASFNEIRLRHGGGGKGWVFSDMAIATSFSDFIGARELEPASTGGTPSHGSFTFRSWQREDGLPHNSIRAITQTREGYLWVGSDEGLARFDGIRFVSFGLRDGLHSGAVRALLEDRDGALWVGTMGGGLARFKDGRFSTITTPEGLPSDSITALAEDVTGRV
ncbi:MAG TPA: two-component regulator propeller domain-containing protein, partial [Terriglobales bacterium]|nr:two-component regulator propeller domain-containing protein [Terriglobales bacterium]